MADITQRLGFDVSQGVSALNSLTGAVNRLNQALAQLNGVNLAGVSGQLNNIGQSLNRTAPALDNLGSSTDRARRLNTEFERQLRGNLRTALQGTQTDLNTTGQAARNFGQSVRGSAGSFVVLGAASGAVRGVVGVLQEAVAASREFGQAIGEVQTIAGDNDSFDSISRSVRELSREFGRPTVEQAEATYQALSNQIIQSANDTEFLADANRLAIASVSEVGDAVSLLSSVINSYGLEASDATAISDTFFKAVEEGRFRIEEIANSLGTVTPLAKEVGVSYQEIAAGIATITKRGTSASVAQTQFRNVLLKLLKPTKQLSQALNNLGFDNATQALQGTGGLPQLLVALQGEADNAGTDLVNLFGRARAGAGALNLVSNEAEDFKNILREVSEESRGAAQEAFEIVNQTDARQAEIALQNLKTTVEELGDTLVPVVTLFVQGLNKIVPSAEALGIALAAAAASAVALAVAAASAIGILGTIGGVLLAALPAIALIALAAGGLTLAISETNAELEELKNARLEGVKQAAEAAAEEVRIEEQKLADLKALREQRVQSLNEAFGKELTSARQSASAIKKELLGAIEAFVDARSKATTEIGKLGERAAGVSLDAGKRIAEGQQKLDDLSFDKSIKGFDAVGRGVRELQRGLQTAREARQQLANAGLNEEKIRAALETRNRAEQQLADAARTADLSKNSTLQRQVNEAQQGFIRDNIRADQQQQRNADKIRNDQAKAAEQKLKEQTETLRKQLTELVQLGNPFDAAGFPKTIEQVNADLQAAADLSKIIRDNLNTDVTGGLAALGGQDADLGRAQNELDAGFAELQFDQGKIRADVQRIVASEPFKAVVEIDQQIEQQGNIINAAKAREEGAKLGQAVQEGLNQAAEALSGGQGFFDRLSDEFSTVGDRVVDFIGKLAGAEPTANKVASAARQLRDNIIATGQGLTGFDSTQIETARQRLEALKNQAEGLNNAGDIGDATLQQATAAIDALRTSLDAREAQLKAQEDATKAAAGESTQNLDRAADAAGNLSNKTRDAAGGARDTAQATAPLPGTLGSAASVASTLASQLERGAAAAERIAAAGSGGGAAGTAFFGRVIRRQTGGLTRGQDRVLTSTAPGEFVVNAAATRRFRSELTAINGQQQPQFRETGGAVTNVGDINVNIQTQDAGDISGRSIARTLKRELRARTSSF